jgi:CrcB protein
MNISSILMVFIGGGVGAAIRWLISLTLNSNSTGFPYATLVVNLVGCFLIGIASAFFLQSNDKLNLLLVVGFLGGFTTFSSFGLELFKFQEMGNWRMFTAYILLSNLLGVLLVIIGNRLTVKFI